MKLQDLKEKLVNKFPNRESSIKDDFKKINLITLTLLNYLFLIIV